MRVGGGGRGVGEETENNIYSRIMENIGKEEGTSQSRMHYR